MRKIIVLSALVLSLAAAGSADAAKKPVAGSISGPVTAVKATTFKVKTTLSPTGTATVQVGSATTITEQVAAKPAAVKAGLCVVAIGQKSKKGVVTAMRVTITQPVKGACNSGFGAGRPGGQGPGGPPGGGAPPQGAPSGGFGPGNANFGLASGKVTAVKGTSVTVKGTSGVVKFTFAKTAQVSETKDVASSSIAVKQCAFVQGTSADKGVTVKATSINLTEPQNGSCSFGRRTP
jgi:hypothetical protein